MCALLVGLPDVRVVGVGEKLRAGPATMGELAAPFSMSRPAVSQHVKVLVAAGLVERQAHAQ